MKTNEHYIRKTTNFQNDVVELGPIGEKRLEEIFMSRSRKYENTTNIPALITFDIDFILYEDNSITYRDLLKEFYNGNNGKNLPLKTYEVKTDTYGLISRNIVYENISNSNPGCLARSKAGYVFYVFIEPITNIIREEYMIDLHALRWWLLMNFDKINTATFQKTNQDSTTTEKKLIATKSMKRGEDNTGIFLIDIDYLVEYSKEHKGIKYGNIVPYYKKF